METENDTKLTLAHREYVNELHKLLENAYEMSIRNSGFNLRLERDIGYLQAMLDNLTQKERRYVEQLSERYSTLTKS